MICSTTFCQIWHKQLAETDEFYHFSTTNQDFGEFSNVSREEYLSCDPRARLVKMMAHSYMICPAIWSKQSRFDYFKTVIDNPFMTAQNREDFIDSFSKAQRAYDAFRRLSWAYKVRHAPLKINHDLILNPLLESQHNVLKLYQNGQNYLFTVTDLKHILENALTHSPYYFSNPLPAKNPYNNMAFDKGILYTIYFFMKRGGFVLSTLFHQFFLANFHLARFRYENSVLIRKFYIRQQLKNGDLDELEQMVHCMLNSNRHTKRFRIHRDFPAEKLVSIFRPYLEMYYQQVYSLDMSERSTRVEELHRALTRFYTHNPKFGMKVLKSVEAPPPPPDMIFSFPSKPSATKRVIAFNDDHPEFKRPNYSRQYVASHIELFEEAVTNAIVREPQVRRRNMVILEESDDDDDDDEEE